MNNAYDDKIRSWISENKDRIISYWCDLIREFHQLNLRLPKMLPSELTAQKLCLWQAIFLIKKALKVSFIAKVAMHLQNMVTVTKRSVCFHIVMLYL